jgi:putative redox protein
MDIVALLHKAGKEPDNFNMKVSGEISKKPPIEYVAIHVLYEFEGSLENREAALGAVTDSQEKYCGVSHMLKKIIPVTWEVTYNGKEIFNNRLANAAILN